MGRPQLLDLAAGAGLLDGALLDPLLDDPDELGEADELDEADSLDFAVLALVSFAAVLPLSGEESDLSDFSLPFATAPDLESVR